MLRIYISIFFGIVGGSQGVSGYLKAVYFAPFYTGPEKIELNSEVFLPVTDGWSSWLRNEDQM